MAEDHPSRYVKLTKDQAPMEDIKPGELNQPIDVPQVQFVRLLSLNYVLYGYISIILFVNVICSVQWSTGIDQSSMHGYSVTIFSCLCQIFVVDLGLCTEIRG